MSEKECKQEENRLWKPKYGEDYWYVSDECYVFKEVWTDHIIDDLKFLCGSVFRTEEEAEYEVERLKVYRELRQFALKSSRYRGSFSIVYDYVNKEINYIENNNTFKKLGELLFRTEGIARRAVEIIGEDKVLKYYLKVE